MFQEKKVIQSWPTQPWTNNRTLDYLSQASNLIGAGLYIGAAATARAALEVWAASCLENYNLPHRGWRNNLVFLEDAGCITAKTKKFLEKIYGKLSSVVHCWHRSPSVLFSRLHKVGVFFTRIAGPYVMPTLPACKVARLRIVNDVSGESQTLNIPRDRDDVLTDILLMKKTLNKKQNLIRLCVHVTFEEITLHWFSEDDSMAKSVCKTAEVPDLMLKCLKGEGTWQ